MKKIALVAIVLFSACQQASQPKPQPPNHSQSLSASLPGPFYWQQMYIDGGASIGLLDGGPLVFGPVGVSATSQTTLGVQCNVQDAGTQAALGGATLLGSMDGKNFYTMASFGLPGGGGPFAFDPITTAAGFLEVVFDAGGTLAGTVSCLQNTNGG